MALIPGVGYHPGPGICFWIWPGSREKAGTTPFNPAAGDPFGTGPGGVLDDDIFNRRYGGRPIRFDGTVGNLVTDAETITGAMTRAMEILAKQGAIPEFTGRPETHTLIPTLLEAHDWAATHSDGGGSLMAQAGVGSGAPGVGGVEPGVPRIEEVSSPGPGRVFVRWITRPGHTQFEVQAGESVYVFKGTILSGVVDLPAGVGGSVEVKVRAFLGATAGRWGLARFVNVEARQGAPEIPPKPEVPPAEPPVTPPAPADPECPARLAKALLELQGAREEITSLQEDLAVCREDLGLARSNLREEGERLRACQVERDRLGGEVDALKADNARLRSLVPVPVPTYVWGTLTMLGSLSGVVMFGAERKQRITRLSSWVSEVAGRKA